MQYVEWGDPDAERVVICVHGLTRNCRDFDFLAQALLPEFRVVCPDVAGRGQSDWLTAKEDYAYPQYCADMTALIARVTAGGKPRRIFWSAPRWAASSACCSPRAPSRRWKDWW